MISTWKCNRIWNSFASRGINHAYDFTFAVFTVYIYTTYIDFNFLLIFSVQDKSKLSVHVKRHVNCNWQRSWHELPSSFACTECCGKRFNIRAYGSWIHCTHRGMRVISTWFHKQRCARAPKDVGRWLDSEIGNAGNLVFGTDAEIFSGRNPE